MTRHVRTSVRQGLRLAGRDVRPPVRPAAHTIPWVAVSFGPLGSSRCLTNARTGQDKTRHMPSLTALSPPSSHLGPAASSRATSHAALRPSNAHLPIPSTPASSYSSPLSPPPRQPHFPRHHAPPARIGIAVACLSDSASSCSPAAPPAPASGGLRDIELVTQVSLDRWPRFAQQALAWGGPVSVAVYIPCPPHHPLASAYLEYLEERVQALRTQLAAAAAAAAGGRNVTAAAAAAPPPPPPPRLTVSLVHAQCLAREGALVLPGVVVPQPPPPPSPPGAVGGGGSDGLSYDGESCLYPINALRNAALAAASSSHVWLVDGDFIPSSGLREALLVMQPMDTAADPPSTPTPSSSSSRDSRNDGIDYGTNRKAGAGSSGGDAAAAVGGVGGVGGGATAAAGGSLLELSVSHPRPVMWVVPAFELVLGGVPAAGDAASPSAAASSAAAAAAAAAPEVPDDQVARVPRTLEQFAACGVASSRGSSNSSSSRSGSGGGDGGGDGGEISGAGTLLRPFHCGRYPQPVPSIDYEAWWTASLGRHTGSDVDGGGCCDGDGGGGGGAEAVAVDPRWITVPYHEYFEPYGIARRDQVRVVVDEVVPR
ncbi:hypothetical protein PLESTF_000098900 [Pleodorina starrii]|nr:hypothetical protein PLESTF_000098900 [Pleodorina starrii]